MQFVLAVYSDDDLWCISLAFHSTKNLYWRPLILRQHRIFEEV